ncbi:hypothetical protein, partial [Lysobacter sp. GCM10012299]|uniref:hypothetical protein n=1 Tax=Lysobacter sp. GCM10012299 TaxID=3317333 RepID=UPI00361B6BEE
DIHVPLRINPRPVGQRSAASFPGLRRLPVIPAKAGTQRRCPSFPRRREPKDVASIPSKTTQQRGRASFDGLGIAPQRDMDVPRPASDRMSD